MEIKEGHEIRCTKCGSNAVTNNGRTCIRKDKTICNGKIYQVSKHIKSISIRLCIECGVPLHVHQTACGWHNVCILYNGVMVSGDKLEHIWNHLTPVT